MQYALVAGGCVLLFREAYAMRGFGGDQTRTARIDRILPVYDRHETHAIRVHARPHEVFAAVAAVTPHEIRFFGTLTALQSLDLRKLAGLGRANQNEITPLIDILKKDGFVQLDEDPDREIVLGTISQYGYLSAGSEMSLTDRKRLTRETFAAFNHPGYAKVAGNFRITEDEGAACVLTTETRILATDAAARRSFGVYWRLISSGSALIRIEWLKAIKRRAERANS